MKRYLVGGAVRDGLLGRPVAERDWVVVGETPATMRRRGFRQVGRDFPVFLHPRSGEEHALARTERNTGAGHADFAIHAAPDVTLEQDLSRRDLTINAMALDGDRLIDPFGGRRDLERRLLRHVSPAFAEDPLRVFRVARLAAWLPEFTIADDTLRLMRTMAPTLAALSGERVWREYGKAAAGCCPARFFEVLERIGPGFWFDEFDLAATGALLRQRAFGSPEQVLIAPGWTNSAAHVETVYQRLRADRLILRAALALARHGAVLAAPQPDAEALLDALLAISAFRQGTLCDLVLAAAESAAGVALDERRTLIGALAALRIDCAPGPAYGEALRARRIAVIRSALAS